MSMAISGMSDSVKEQSFGRWTTLPLNAVHGLICLAALFGNLFFWMTLLRYPNLRTTANSLLLNLSAGDLLVSTVRMPLTVSSFCGER